MALVDQLNPLREGMGRERLSEHYSYLCAYAVNAIFGYEIRGGYYVINKGMVMKGLSALFGVPRFHKIVHFWNRTQTGIIVDISLPQVDNVNVMTLNAKSGLARRFERDESIEANHKAKDIMANRALINALKYLRTRYQSLFNALLNSKTFKSFSSRNRGVRIEVLPLVNLKKMATR
ncbi:MAG: hypothetical protein U9O94_07455 [Nanoarchaeota archaeon]|nr:hypothetical protein [Nanoarchaeota archaeon]